jgi:hypothetical protein
LRMRTEDHKSNFKAGDLDWSIAFWQFLLPFDSSKGYVKFYSSELRSSKFSQGSGTIAIIELCPSLHEFIR